MNCVLAILTGLSVLAHSIFGCCDHVVASKSNARPSCSCHGIARTNAPSPAVAKATRASATQTKSVASKSPTSPVRKHECKHASCHWLADGKTTLSHVPLEQVVYIAIPIEQVIDFSIPSQFANAHLGSLADGPPVRLHLLVGVLLV